MSYEPIHNNKKRNVAKVINLLINHAVEFPPLIPYTRCPFFWCCLIILPCTLIYGVILPRHSWKPLWEVLWFSWWGSCTWTKYPLVHSPHSKIHHKVNLEWYPLPNTRDCLYLAGLWWFEWECFHTVHSCENCLQAWQDVQANAQANPQV